MLKQYKKHLKGYYINLLPIYTCIHLLGRRGEKIRTKKINKKIPFHANNMGIMP